MCDVGDKLLGGIKSMYVGSLSCVKDKGGESEWFRIDTGVRQGCIMSPLAFKCIYGCSDGGENGDGKEGRGWR